VNLKKKIKCAVENDDNVKGIMSFKYLGRISTVIVIVFHGALDFFFQIH
jgi:hypothetical protein